MVGEYHLFEIERILNSRPLCLLSSESNDLNSLTPADLLINRSLTVIQREVFVITQKRLYQFQKPQRLC